jgi:hypothetical protein
MIFSVRRAAIVPLTWQRRYDLAGPKIGNVVP